MQKKKTTRKNKFYRFKWNISNFICEWNCLWARFVTIWVFPLKKMIEELENGFWVASQTDGCEQYNIWLAMAMNKILEWKMSPNIDLTKRGNSNWIAIQIRLRFLLLGIFLVFSIGINIKNRIKWIQSKCQLWYFFSDKHWSFFIPLFFHLYGTNIKVDAFP